MWKAWFKKCKVLCSQSLLGTVDLGENSMYFYFYFTWFSNLSYLASSFLRTYCTHVLMLSEGPLRCRGWLKALTSTQVGGQRAGAEQLPSSRWTFVTYKLFSMPSGARMVPWLRELLEGCADTQCLCACSLPRSAVTYGCEYVRAISLNPNIAPLSLLSSTTSCPFLVPAENIPIPESPWGFLFDDIATKSFSHCPWVTACNVILSGLAKPSFLPH